jgi:hypothetical protein
MSEKGRQEEEQHRLEEDFRAESRRAFFDDVCKGNETPFVGSAPGLRPLIEPFLICL